MNSYLNESDMDSNDSYEHFSEFKQSINKHQVNKI